MVRGMRKRYRSLTRRMCYSHKMQLDFLFQTGNFSISTFKYSAIFIGPLSTAQQKYKMSSVIASKSKINCAERNHTSMRLYI